LLVVPGDFRGGGGDELESGEFEHGWPWLHLRRISGDYSAPPGLRDNAPWFYRDAWGLGGDVAGFSPSMLAANVVITLLISVAAMAGFEWWRRRRRRLWQFSLRELLVATFLIAIALSWWQWRRQRFQREQRAVATVNELVSVSKEYQGPQWLRRLVGTKRLDFLHTVTSVSCREGITDDHLQQARPCLESWRNVEGFHFPYGTNRVTDEGLECISHMTSLRGLHLWFVGITDEGLVHLSRMKDLRELDLLCEEVTGVGLEHLRGCSRLERLLLGSLKLDDRGLEAIGNLKGLRGLHIIGPQVTGAGMVHVARLKDLQWLYLDNTAVDDRGMEHLATMDGLKELYVEHNTRVTDTGLVHLEQLPNLQYVYLHCSGVTEEGVERLRRALPGCEIYLHTPPTPEQGDLGEVE